MVSATIEPLAASAAPAVLELVRRCDLPLDGLAEHFGDVLVARNEQGDVIGCVALELYGKSALLRSLAVRESARNQGLGRELTYAALRQARENGATTIYLLTTTAERFFATLGFESIPRDQVAPKVRESVEFTQACPVTAAVMVKHCGASTQRR
jgi:amino-acid N-acetyltransferase